MSRSRWFQRSDNNFKINNVIYFFVETCWTHQDAMSSWGFETVPPSMACDAEKELVEIRQKYPAPATSQYLGREMTDLSKLR